MSRSHSCRIVHVDDNPLDLELMQLAFAEIGDGTVAYRGMTDPTAAARQLTSGAGDPPEVLVLDLNMPVTTGAQILERVRQDPRLDAVRVIIFTTSSDPDDRERCLALGATAVITKPATFSELVDVARVLISHC